MEFADTIEHFPCIRGFPTKTAPLLVKAEPYATKVSQKLFDAFERMQRADHFEKVIALVVNQNECREILHFNLIDRFHTEIGPFNAL